ncbi:MAG: TauD/TfdA family dioxygenase [Chromatiales bacterium]|nr:TauD/TfdA family dioxygenase [Chromatiales bacterium]
MPPAPTRHSAPSRSPFALDDSRAYDAWRAEKLESVQLLAASPRIIEVDADPSADRAALANLRDEVARHNVAVYRSRHTPDDPIAFVRTLGSALGLKRIDGNLCADEASGVSVLEVAGAGRATGYIPYTNRPLSWHTDGYYNDADHQVRGWILHCVRPAQTGGENALLDHELAYIALRDADPRYIEALSHPEAMAIPPNEENGTEIRGWTIGPVFSTDATGHLHMRYSARGRNIRWRDHSATRDARALLDELLGDANPQVRHLRLAPNEGLVSNNVLHNRTGFTDGEQPEQQRRILRARYFDRVATAPTTEA